MYDKNRGGDYVRRYVIPKDPKTAAQRTSRDVLSTANSIWRRAPSLFKSPWDASARRETKSGYDKWIGRFLEDNRSQSDLTNMIFSPGALGGRAPLDAVPVSGAGQIAVTVVAPATPTGWTLQAAVVAVLRDGDPAATSFFEVTAGEDLSDPFEVILTGLTPAVLYVVGAWLRWAKPDGSIAYSPSLQTSATPSAAYSANGVDFNGTNTRLDRGGGFTGAVDNKKLLLNFWFHLNGQDGAAMWVINTGAGRISLLRVAGNKLQFIFQTSAGATVWAGDTTQTFTVASHGWVNWLQSLDAGLNEKHLYINDTPETIVAETFNDATIDWTDTDHFIGAHSAAGFYFDAGMADCYLTNDHLLLATEANRRKFIDASGKPVDLGATGQLPTGSSPLSFNSGPTATWHTNLGPGGGYVEVGALTQAATSPSD